MARRKEAAWLPNDSRVAFQYLARRDNSERQPDLFTKRVRRAPAPLEIALHRQVVEVLRRWCKPGWQWNHPASGEYRTPATAAKLWQMGVNPGWPDLLLFSPNGVPHCLEFKRRRGNLTEHQSRFAEWCHGAGVAYVVCDSLRSSGPAEQNREADGALDVLERWGALKVKVRVAA